MRTWLTIAWYACVLAIAWPSASSVTVANDDSYVVVVHPSNPIRTLARSELRAAFLKQVTRWPHGGTIRPTDVLEPGQVRNRFNREALGRSSERIRSYWVQRIFTGTGVPPVEVSSPREAVAYVLAHPGAITYLPATFNPGGTKVIEVR
jgi:hypothetical protein